MTIHFDTTEQVVAFLSKEDGLPLNPELLAQAGKVKKPSKFKNRPTESFGIVFQSGKEAEDYGKLMLGLRSGLYAFVLRQIPFILQEKPEQVVYVADFVIGNLDGTWSVLDSKGAPETDVFKLKAKLFKQKYNRDIVII